MSSINHNNKPVGEEEVNKVEELLSQLSLIHNVKKDEDDKDDKDDKDLNAETIHLIHQLVNDFQSHHKSISPITIFNTLTPFLFITNSTNNANVNVNVNANVNANTNVKPQISSKMALQTLVTIVSSNPNMYTLPAITSIHNYVQQTILPHFLPPAHTTSTTNNTEFHISIDLIKIIFPQMQHSNTTISNYATKVLLNLATKLPPSSKQCYITSIILIQIYEYVLMLQEDIKVSTSTSSSSIALIRVLSLMIDILISIANSSSSPMEAFSYIHLGSLYNNTNTSTNNTSTNTTTITSKTILEPITQLLKYNQYQQQQKSKKYDPLLVMNIFELLEKMSLSTNMNTNTSRNNLLYLWISKSKDEECNMMEFLLSAVGFQLDYNENGSGYGHGNGHGHGHGNWSLKANGEIDLFCYSSALNILSMCCCNSDYTSSNNVKDVGLLSPPMMMEIFKNILHQCINEGNDEVAKIQYISALTTFIQGSNNDECHGDGDGNVSGDGDDVQGESEGDKRFKLVLQETDIVEFWFYFKRGNSKFKTVLLHSIAQVLQNGTMDDDTVMTTTSASSSPSPYISNEMCKTVYSTIGTTNGNTTTTELLMEQVKSSIIEIRLATYELFKSMIVNRETNSGIYLIVSHAGFLEWMLSRNVEFTKEGKEMKFDIIKGILGSDVGRLLNGSVIQLLERYVDQGPHYLRGVGGEIMIE